MESEKKGEIKGMDSCEDRERGDNRGGRGRQRQVESGERPMRKTKRKKSGEAYRWTKGDKRRETR